MPFFEMEYSKFSVPKKKKYRRHGRLRTLCGAGVVKIDMCCNDEQTLEKRKIEAWLKEITNRA